ncbi:LPS export ABC transporter permease LptG [Allofranklinella schreckenbergeri]|uniref:LPS export ABC transporter permease LptG n=1 Tax=Allofranklinella schreckenbergeri TaxID=1076744 RepID=A0A3M6Q7J9_9BURK|nr:LPS export ABC transporter permease LptG [Allofranklinella schreckenbergeri]RMW99135.1 LPS export ABC transporter permease LptG [Allofranklinella schreckenbergeri]RRD42099.1 LptF/LptG family permease [Comamonadaceae bacterium OH3737_COT-264]
MKIVTRMLQSEIIATVAMTTLAFLALLLFFDLIDESRFVSRSGVQSSYGVAQMLGHMALSAPMHVYELLPICVLIGSVFVMARYARTSQFTILRTGGLGPGQALGILLSVGLLFTAVTFVMGDYVAPWAERSAQLLRAKHLGGQVHAGRAGAWLRERQAAPAEWQAGGGQDGGEQTGGSVIVSVAAVRTDGLAQGVRIFQFGPDGRLQRQIRADSAELPPAHDAAGQGAWLLHNAHEQVLPAGVAPPVLQADGSLNGALEPMRVQQHARLRWPTTLSREMLDAAILKPDGMSTMQLISYVNHLRANDQSTQRFEIELWRKVFYPLGCLVMMVLALPFAYLHFRSGSIVGHMFLGILVGISYLMLNNVLGYVGNLRGWSPLLAAATPALLYSALALGVFVHMVRKR